MANFVYLNGVIVDEATAFAGGGGGGGGGGLIQFDRDGATTTVFKDTITSANTIPLPVEVISGGGGGGAAGPIEYSLNGVDTVVADDTVTPANSKPLPVKIIGGLTAGTTTVVDFLDSGLIDTSVANIARSSLNATSVVATLASAVTKVQIIEDIGAFMALYSDAARTSILCYLPLGGGEVEVSIPATTAIFIGHLEDTDITSGKIAINFLG